MQTETPQEFDRLAYYGRVSTPRQKIEHQRDHVTRFVDSRGLTLPDHQRYEDIGGKRHQSAKREAFQRLLEECRKGTLDWIVIASFDRWGVADPDEFSDFRRQLRSCEVQLYSVVDQLNLTSINEGDYFRIVALAIGATRYVQQQAEKNIMKMLEMAKGGLAATGNAPYATDLVCYPLLTQNTPDLTRPFFRVERVRYIRPAVYRITYPDGSEEVTERMPLRDKKTTGYRFEPSLDPARIKAVNLIYELYDNGMKSFGDISESLWKQGYKHYDKPFGFHGIETILRNPVYIGQPTWGKQGVGAYYLLQDGEPTRAQRKAKDPFVVSKGEGGTVTAFKPTFDPIVPVELWQRVQATLDDRPKSDPAFGMRRQRSKLIHPLNGKVVCPDCGNPMVMGASQSKGYKKSYFLCGLYRRTIRKQCRANSIPWKTFDDGITSLLDTVKDRIGSLTGDKAKLVDTLGKQEWAKQTELGTILTRVYNLFFNGVDETGFSDDEDQEILDFVRSGGKPGGTKDNEELDFATALGWAIEWYNRSFEESARGVRDEMAAINAELDRIADAVMQGIPSATVRAKLNQRMSDLERRKRELEPSLVPLTATVDALMDQLGAIKTTIAKAESSDLGSLLDRFVEKVIPRFDCDPIPGHARPVTLEFVPKEGARNFMPQPMKIPHTRTGTDSSPRPI